MWRTAIVVVLITAAGTARAEPARSESSQLSVNASTAMTLDKQGVLVQGELEVAGAVPGAPGMWGELRFARGWSDDGEMTHRESEAGVGILARRCRWPAFTCGDVGVVVAGSREDGGGLGVALVPEVAGELGIGPIALRAGVHGRLGHHAGVGASLAIALRF